MIAWLALVALAGDPEPDWIDAMTAAHGLTEEQEAAVRAIAGGSDRLGQGLPGPTTHPMTGAECERRREAAGLQDRAPDFEAICGRPYMAPLYDPRSEEPAAAQVCIDQYEFPGVPCAYPVVWVRASEAAKLCEAVGKRLCDAHEWEGACAGRLREPDYRFDLARAALAAGGASSQAVRAMRVAHNAAEVDSRAWAYGDVYQEGVCGAASTKAAGCDGSDPQQCGSNTYPTGAFPGCVSELGVYDQHGNAAEHMNLPLAPEQMASAGQEVLGVTEMKGSWFIFDHYRAHEDWCRWRAPFWHGGPVQAPDSHRNYHLGFRCCAEALRVCEGPIQDR